MSAANHILRRQHPSTVVGKQRERQSVDAIAISVLSELVRLMLYLRILPLSFFLCVVCSDFIFFFCIIVPKHTTLWYGK